MAVVPLLRLRKPGLKRLRLMETRRLLALVRCANLATPAPLPPPVKELVLVASSAAKKF